MVYEVGPKGTLYLAWRYTKPEKMESVLGTHGASEDPYERRVKKCQVGQVQGDKGLSLTGFRSCTTDSMDINGKGWRSGDRWGR